MQRAGFLWMLPLLIGCGAAAHADPAFAPPAPATEVKEAAPGGGPSSSPAVTTATDSPDAVSLDLHDAKAADVSQALRKALGIEVRIEGRLPKPVTLHLEDVPRSTVMAQIAAATGGAWRRTFFWTPGANGHPQGTETQAPGEKTSGKVVTLHLTQAPCRSAAAIVATSVGAWAEGHEPLTGRVTLDKRDMPLEEALDAIAAKSGASWRELLALRMPGFEPRKAPSVAKTPAVPKRSATKTAAKTPGRPRRNKFTVLAKYGAKAPTPVVVDPDAEEARAKMGVFGAIFACPDKKERLQKVRKLRASMETQVRRLEAYRPEYRGTAISFEIQQLRSIQHDYDNLNAEQKKEVTALMQYVNKRLATIQAPDATGTATKKPVAGARHAGAETKPAVPDQHAGADVE
jgi:hypothetical protein